jgi:putative heme-binding domain-containing protein
MGSRQLVDWQSHCNRRRVWKLCRAALAPLLLVSIPSLGLALEPWADSALPVKEGLHLWLDAGRQPQARESRGYAPLRDGDKLGTLLDGSGLGRHFAQRRQESQPKWRSLGELAALEFDGQDDCLSLDGQKLEYKVLTLFLVAAPRSNTGYFRAFFAMNERGRNDYTTGITIDQSGAGSARFENLNPEGKGFGGAADMMTDSFPFRTPHVLSVVVGDRQAGVSLFVDGRANGRRERTADLPAEIHELSLGARFYSNTREPPFLSGFLDGYIFELLLYDRELADDERKRVENFLSARYAQAPDLLAQDIPTDPDAAPLTPVENPPPVQVFAPGFAARRLPLKLTNINNVKYREDGKLVALGYDGRIWLLSDTDGDGLEDRAEPFWDRGGLRGPIGMDLTPRDYPHGRGVFVASKGKLSLIVDQNGDDRADREIVVAQGWREAPHSVDALGVAVAADGSIYFGLGTADFTNAYLLENGRSRYDLASERGTVLRVASDFKTREIVCTGIRFPVAMAFNRQGDLFSTDQEGATWLANGNPFDELLHIQPGRHYGFPPRHPSHLPGVIDEPSDYDYGPQHQSTCGLNFNSSPEGQPIFGPAWWCDDALVCGYSRGKLYRTRLVKTESGYVAQTAILACLNMLTADSCLSPEGDLLIATHSGLPDWGTGPQGEGVLYKISYVDRETPQPVAVWAASPQEVRIAFDRPLNPGQLKGLASRIRIEYGQHVRAGDRFESLRPGYQVVQDQLLATRRKLAVHGVSLSQDRTTLIVATGLHPQAVQYAVAIDAFGRAEQADNALSQHDAIDLDYALHGVEATWTGDKGEPLSLWLPHIDLAVARELTAGSAEHRRFFEQLSQPGRLTLRTQLNLAQLLRPAVQPGAQIDYAWPAELPSLALRGSGELRVTTSIAGAAIERDGSSVEIDVQQAMPGRARLPLEVTLATGDGEPQLSVSYHTNEDARPRALPLHRLFVPWAPGETASEQPSQRTLLAELAGGDWLRGREVFYHGAGQCAACHTIDGRGGRAGPDLSNLRQRDYASVLRDILTPSAAINPEYVAYAVHLADGRVLSGAVRTEGDRVLVAFTKESAAGRTVEEIALAKDEVEELKPLAASVMPDGLAKTLGEESLKHLVTFLLAPPPEELRPAPIERPGAPPARKRAEVRAVLDASPKPPAAEKPPLRILLVAGPKDHGVNEHDYPQWQTRWAKLLSLGENVQVTTADSWPTPQEWSAADVAVFYSANPAWAPEKAKELDEFQQRGGGLVLLHYAVNGNRAPEELAERIGLAWQGGASKFRHGDLTLDFTPAGGHPIVAGLPPKLDFTDESYWQLVGDQQKINVLATAAEEGAPQPLLWTCERGKGRVFGSILGHYSWTFDDPLFRLIVLRGIAWTSRQPEDRLSELAALGARIAE